MSTCKILKRSLREVAEGSVLLHIYAHLLSKFEIEISLSKLSVSLAKE